MLVEKVRFYPNYNIGISLLRPARRCFAQAGGTLPTFYVKLFPASVLRIKAQLTSAISGILNILAHFGHFRHFLLELGVVAVDPELPDQQGPQLLSIILLVP
jgi:hypothetical protein